MLQKPIRQNRIAFTILAGLVIISPMAVLSTTFAAESAPLFVFITQHEYARVEQETSKWLSDYSSGKITGDELYDQFQRMVPKTGGVGKEAHFLEWLKQYPRSYPATLATGIFYKKLAWELRGNAYANQTTQKQFDDFQKYLLVAEKYLLESVLLDPKPLPSYCQLMIVAKGLGNSKGALYYGKALEVDSTSYQARHLRLEELAPKWGGSIDKVDNFMAMAKVSPMREVDKRRLVSEASVLKGEYSNAREDYSAAVAYYRDAYQAYPEPESLKHLSKAGEIAQKADMVEGAVEIFTRIIAIDKRPNIFALGHRGFLYETKIRDLKKAFSDYSAAAEAGDSWAQNKLGWWYMTGTYVKKDYDTAELYLNKAASQGNKSAKANLKDIERLRGSSALQK